MRRTNRRLTLLAAGLLATSVYISPARAQDQEAARPAAEEAGSPDIVVTARRRAENLQDVPIAVSAFGGGDTERLQTATTVDLSGKAPNLYLKQNPTTTVSPSIYIRGVGQDESHFASENAVGVYLDGVYLARASGTIIELLDLESIQVLRGPQGTLFGKNSPAGAMILTSGRPDLDDSFAKGTLTAGNYDHLAGTASFSTPLVEGKLGLKIDFGARSNDGWMRENVSGTTVNGTERLAGRISLLWEPTETAAVTLIADHSRDRSEPYAPTFVVGRTPVHGLFETYILPEFNRNQRFDAYGVTGIIDLELSDALSLRSITGYREFEHLLWGELIGARDFAVPLQRDHRQHQISQELQLNVSLDRLEAVVGAIYFFEENKEAAFNAFAGATNGGGNLYPVSEQDSESYAIFAEASYDVADWLSLTLGGRLGHDKKSISRISTNQPGGTGPIVAYNVPNLEESWTEFTPRAIVELKPFGEDVLLYASFARGYKAGAFDPAFTGNQALAEFIFDPEKVTTYEAGVKASFLDSRLRVNAAYYFSKYDDYQSADCTFGANSVCVPASFDAELSGVEIEVVANPVDGLSLFANLSTIDDEIKSGAAVGNELENTPSVTYFLGGEYETDVSADHRIVLGANWQWTDDYFHDLQNGTEARTDSYGLLSAHIGFGAADDRWEVRLFGRNLLDEDYIVNALTGGSWWVGQPRTYGVRLNFRI